MDLVHEQDVALLQVREDRGEVSRPVSLTIGPVTADGRSFTATATVRVDRTEFGVTAMRGLAGRYLDLTVEVQCARR